MLQWDVAVTTHRTAWSAAVAGLSKNTCYNNGSLPVAPHVPARCLFKLMLSSDA